MTVKVRLYCHQTYATQFMTPNIRRGDLYTQQGIVHMLRSGISVCPLVMSEWVDVVTNQWSSHMPFSERQVGVRIIEAVPRATSAVENEPLKTGARIVAQRQWRELRLDRFVDQCQLYINVCRQSLGLHQVFWASQLHDHIVSDSQFTDFNG